MKIRYCKLPHGNFGDDINAELWQLLFPNIQNTLLEYELWGVGTLLAKSKTQQRHLKIVLGCGTGYKKPPKLDSSWQVFFVRGPLTAQKLCLPEEKAITDPSILLLKYMEIPNKKRFEYAFIPHHQSLQIANWALICKKAGIHMIDPRNPPKQVIAEIAASQYIISESLHGAIFADALRIPWLPVVSTKHILSFKWLDWCQAMALEYTPILLHPTLHEMPLSHTKKLKYKALNQLSKHQMAPRKYLLAPTQQTDHQAYAAVAAALVQLKDASKFILSEDNRLKEKERALIHVMHTFAKQYDLKCTL